MQTSTWIPSVPVKSVAIAGIHWPPSLSLPLPSAAARQGKGLAWACSWLMTHLLRCTLPCWRTLALLHFSALIGKSCKLSSLCMWGPGLSQPTTHSAKCLGLIKHCARVTHFGSVYCVMHIYKTVGRAPRATLLTEAENLWEKLSYSYAVQKKNAPHVFNRTHYDTKQWQSK